MKHKVLTACFAVPLAIAPATAASPVKTVAQTREMMHDYARCVVKESPQQASRAVLTGPNSEQIERSGLVSKSCFRYVGGAEFALRFKGDFYLFALADALVNAEFATTEHGSFADRARLAQRPQPDRARHEGALAKVKDAKRRQVMDARFALATETAWLSRFGECVVRQDPGNARHWLLTVPASPEETARIEQLKPSIGLCLGDGTAKFTRINLRGAVALNYYRLAHAPVIVG